MPPNRLWELLARKYNNELKPDEQEELDQLLRQHQDTFELNEAFTRLKDLDVRPLTTSADEERSRQSIAARLAAANLIQPQEQASQERPQGLQQQQPQVQNRQQQVQQEPQQQQPVQLSEPQHSSVLEPAEPSRPIPLYRTAKFWTAAAAVVATITISLTLIFRTKTTEPAQLATESEIVTSKSKSKIQLPDGSVVILNKQSKLAYNKDFGITKREITLTGEAYFDIAKNENTPLTVTAGPIKIMVMGTAFNVRAYTDDSIVETSLIKGSIAVSSSDDPDRIIRMRPNEKLTFGKELPATQVTVNGQQPIQRKTAQNYLVMNKIKANPIDSTINEIVWLQDKLVFSREPFYSVAQKMERWFQVRIRFRDKISEQLTLTGSLEKESLIEALDALQQLTPFNYQIDNGIVTISKNTNPI